MVQTRAANIQYDIVLKTKYTKQRTLLCYMCTLISITGVSFSKYAPQASQKKVREKSRDATITNRYQEEEETDITKQAQIEQTHERHQD